MFASGIQVINGAPLTREAPATCEGLEYWVFSYRLVVVGWYLGEGLVGDAVRSGDAAVFPDGAVDELFPVVVGFGELFLLDVFLFPLVTLGSDFWASSLRPARASFQDLCSSRPSQPITVVRAPTRT